MNAARKKRWKEASAGLIRRIRLASGYLGLRHPFCGAMQTVMLLYHRVVPRTLLPEVCSLPQIVVPLDHFEAQLEFLSSQYQILSMGEFEQARLERRPLPLRTAVITFDDGWEDNHTYAFPALKRRGIPATIFISTAHVGTTQAFWHEQILYLLTLWQRRVQSGELQAADARQLPHGLRTALLSPHGDRGALHLIESLKMADESTRASLLAALAARLQPPPFPSQANAFMNWNQMREMQAAGIEFGSHARTHRLLSHLPAHEAEEEVRESRRELEDELGAPVTTFAYPNGNHNAAVIAALKAAGYRIAATTTRGINTAWTNPFELRRINMNGAMFTGSNGLFSKDLFAIKLTGLR